MPPNEQNKKQQQHVPDAVRVHMGALDAALRGRLLDHVVHHPAADVHVRVAPAGEQPVTAAAHLHVVVHRVPQARPDDKCPGVPVLFFAVRDGQGAVADEVVHRGDPQPRDGPSAHPGLGEQEQDALVAQAAARGGEQQLRHLLLGEVVAPDGRHRGLVEVVLALGEVRVGVGGEVGRHVGEGRVHR